MEVSDKQKRFCDVYLIDLNATKAYKTVYKVKNDNTAAVNAQRLLRNAKVKFYIKKRKETLSKKLEITQEMVLEGYRKLAFYDARKYYDASGNLISIQDLDDETAFALSSFEVTEEKGGDGAGQQVILGYTKKIKTSDRRAALDSICRVLGFNAAEKKDVTINSFLDFLKESSSEQK